MSNKITTLYTLDSKNKIRIWEIYVERDRYYTRDYIENGKVKDWVSTICVAKNVGKTNATTAESQAESDANNLITRKLKENYFRTSAEAKTNKAFRPMLAHKFQDYVISYPVYSQPKLDGIRCNAMLLDGVVVLKTRTGGDIVSCPHIADILAPILENFPNLVFDGEIYKHELRNDFEELVSLIRKTKPTKEDYENAAKNLEYHIYDCYIKDVPEAPFADRAVIVKAIPQVSPLVIVETTEVTSKEDLDTLYQSYLAQEYEGQMVRGSSAYKVDGRSKDLLKRKEFHDAEFEIVDIEEGKGTWEGYAKKVWVKLDNGQLCGCGLKGDFKQAQKVLANKQIYIGKRATVTYFERTADGSLRFPVIKDINRLND